MGSLHTQMLMRVFLTLPSDETWICIQADNKNDG